MSEWTNQELEWTYEYAKKVYEKQISKSEAQDWLKKTDSDEKSRFFWYVY